VKRPALYLLLLLIALLALAVLALVVGASGLGWAQIRDGLDATELTILWQLRLPRVLMAILAGSGLAVSGALMQTYFRNPLAEPYITGVSAGGALGAVAATALGLTGIQISVESLRLGGVLGSVANSLINLTPVLITGLSAALGGSIITVALYLFALRRHRHGTLGTLLLGLALGTLCGALVWFVLLKLGPGGTGQALAWLLGRVATVGYQEILMLAPVTALGLGLALYYMNDLDALLLGEEKAAGLGVNLLAARRGILLAATLLATVNVAFCGVIAFVGLMVPHVVRTLVGARHRWVLPLSAAGGAALLLGVDLVARTLDAPREIPLTIITSLLGAPFFIGVLLKSREVQV
jgi:iron complex transport system permease protein